MASLSNPHHPLLTINLSNITKLSSTNYLTWSLQIQSLLEGYDLHHFIDGTHTPPPPTVTITGVASQIRHTQLGSVKIVSSLAFSLVLSPFHYNRLLPAPPLPLMHGKP
ncbi:Retrovirus-related Pol polyprotein from transposon RE1 [Vitis vinifera]|uniref:Retrovirus-related Pol polyprotein from transposon RE1 n=1 Tax=Vitis vinifera TaxID=29760 RepID=A0A438DWR5_VITVI|nr:Retrovirus-related Pol polyprotein from transposon RE1 [Vitis vinifera]